MGVRGKGQHRDERGSMAANPEMRDVRPAGIFEEQIVVRAICLIKGAKLGTDAAGFDADDGIEAGIVGDGAAKDLNAENIFFELAGSAGQPGFNGELQEPADARGADEERMFFDPEELPANLVGGDGWVNERFHSSDCF